jgi:hypothetical protein
MKPIVPAFAAIEASLAPLAEPPTSPSAFPEI